MTHRAQAGRWTIVVLVFCAVMLNYVDRQTLALLKPTLELEFSWSDQDYGNMASAFQFAAAFGFLGAGWFIDRVGLRTGFAVGVAAWSLAGMAHGLVGSVAGFITVRMLLGFAESVGTPAAIKAAATYFRPEERSIALGIGNAAPNIGAILTPLAIPLIAVALGWRAAFLIAGGLGLIWVAAWYLVRLPAEAAQAREQPRIRWIDLVRDRRTLAIAIAKILSDQVWFFMLSWLPDLFHRLFGLPQGTVGLPVAIVFVFAALGALTGGWLPTRLLASGWSINRARKASLLFYALLVLPVPLVLWAQSPWSAALLLGLALFAHQGFSTNLFGLTTDVVPARSVGSTIGIVAFCGNLGSIGMIQLSGWSLANGHGYAPMLGVCALSYLAAFAVLQLLIPRITALEHRR
ncbi:MAG: MFS transporter [Sphingobium sp.]